jgi:hypothetical protein
MHSQGRRLRADEILKIIRLLVKTELSLTHIAERMQCSRGTVATINRKYSIRDYGGRRTEWEVSERLIAPVSEEQLSDVTQKYQKIG